MKKTLQLYKDLKGPSVWRAFAVLCFLLPCSVYGFWPSDTIIIDGQVVEIERRVEVDTVWVDKQNPDDLKPNREKHFELEFSLISRFARYRGNSLADDLLTLENFISLESRAVGGVGINAEFRKVWDNTFVLRSGIGAVTQGWNAADFDSEQLDDSLFQFYSPNPEELYQITQIRYPDLGTESDTLALNWSRSEFRYFSIRIPIVFSYLIQVREWGKSHHFETGLGLVNKLNFLYKSENSALINQNADWKRFEESEIDIPTLQVLARAEIGWFYRFKSSNNSIGFRAYFQTPFQPFEAVSDNLEIQGSESGIDAYFRFFFK